MFRPARVSLRAYPEIWLRFVCKRHSRCEGHLHAQEIRSTLGPELMAHLPVSSIFTTPKRAPRRRERASNQTCKLCFKSGLRISLYLSRSLSKGYDWPSNPAGCRLCPETVSPHSKRRMHRTTNPHDPPMGNKCPFLPGLKTTRPSISAIAASKGGCLPRIRILTRCAGASMWPNVISAESTSSVAATASRLGSATISPWAAQSMDVPCRGLPCSR